MDMEKLASLGIDVSKLSLQQKADIAAAFKKDVKEAKDAMKPEKEAILNTIWKSCGSKLVNFLDLKGYSFNSDVTLPDGEVQKLQVIIRWAPQAKAKNGKDEAAA